MVYREGCQPMLHSIDQHCVTLFCVTQEIVTLAATGSVYEGGYKRVEMKERYYVRVDGELM
jgi:hypothetical protein